MSKKTNHLYRIMRLRYAAAGILAGVLLLGGQTQVQAAKATPLSNLAEGIKEIKSYPNVTVEHPEKLTDGDKYYLSYDGNTNKKGDEWEPYVEDGNSAKISGKKSYIQIDLGDSYPIEVINVKMRNYVGQSTFRNGSGDSRMKRLTGTKAKYKGVSVVIGENEHLTDGQVVFCQEGAMLPDGVKRPDQLASGAPEMAEMGGEWFYMDYSKGLGLEPSSQGTTKTARYIRVYAECENLDNLEFMELGVYGYKDEKGKEDSKEEALRYGDKRRLIDNKHPLMIATAYSDDVLDRTKEGTPGLQGYNTVQGRWNAIPDDLKPYNVMMLHTNNMRQFSPDHIAQAYLQEYYERGLQDGYECGASIMLMCIGASSVHGGADWYITGCIDYGWLDLMYRMYPNMQGIFNSENGWSGHKNKVAAAASEMLEIADRFGGFFVWSELHNVFGYEPNTIKTMLEKHGDSFFITYKNTEVGGHDLEDMSVYQGAWLADYIGGWGMLSDTWSWDKRYSKLWQGGNGYSNWQKLCGEPESLLGIQMLTTYLNGGVIYTFEFPELVYGSKDTNAPANVHVIQELFRYFVENPAPDQKEILAETKAMTYGISSLHDGLNAPEERGFNTMKTGRYGLIPALPTIESKEKAVARLASKVKQLEVEMPDVLSNNDAVLASKPTRVKHFQGLYNIEYVGSAFAQKRQGTWFVFNSMVNTDKKQAAVIPAESHKDGRIKTTLDPHTFFYMEEGGDGSVDITLNNYRVNKDFWVFDNPQGWNWKGSFAAGQVGTLPGKLAVYNYMLTKNVVNAQGEIEIETFQGNNALNKETVKRLSPDDNEFNYDKDGNITQTKGFNFRTTVFEFTKVTQAPTVKVVDAQKPDTDNQPQYKDPVVTFDKDTGKAVVSIEHNGWVKLSVTDLAYAEDKNAVEIVDGVSIDGGGNENQGLENLAQLAATSFSAAPSGDRVKHATDGNKTTDNYADPGGDAGGAHWVQFDMNGLHKVEEVKLWRYFNGGRQYRDTVILLSPEASFPKDKTLVLWNANDNAERQWPKSMDGKDGTHKLPEGTDPLYPEVKEGKSFKVYDQNVKWLDADTNRPIPKQGEAFEARYARVYLNGSNENNSNHIVEVEIKGKQGEIELVDKEAPTTPTALSVSREKGRSMLVDFAPSADNYGVDHYEVEVTGQESRSLSINQTSVLLEGLPMGEYSVKVTAVDAAGNRSGQAHAEFVVPEITVEASLPEGHYDTAQNVELIPLEEGGELYYTLDGHRPFDGSGNPTAGARLYSGAILVERSSILRAAVKKDGVVYSVFSWQYVIGGQEEGDFNAPNAPGDLRVDSRTADAVVLSWSGDEAGVVYQVYVNGEKEWEGSALQCSIRGLNPLTAYQIYVTAMDAAENESLRSATVEVITKRK